MIAYRGTLDVPMELLRFVTRLLILERRRRCTPHRLPPTSGNIPRNHLSRSCPALLRNRLNNPQARGFPANYVRTRPAGPADPPSGPGPDRATQNPCCRRPPDKPPARTHAAERMAAYQAAQLLDDLRCQPRLAGRVHESIELVVQVEGLKTGRERRRSAIRAGCSQANVYT